MTPVLRLLDERELFDWLRLIRTDTIGPRTFQSLLERYGSARAALDALPRLTAGRALKLATIATIEAELAAAERSGVRFVPLCDPAYPPSLRVIAAPPPLLAVRGRLDILQRSMVAIVGSRNASANGLIFTDRLAIGIGRAGHVVVSGLARGIDARAHAASLDTGTVGVLAGGHNRIYPSEHRGLVDRIAEAGAIVSEMPIDWEPRGRDFPRRNRIVSGLALGVVVVEAARRSGSLITARFGNEQGRAVFAVPGSPFDPRAEGTNDLLRAGASFCTSADDVTSELEPMLGGSPHWAVRDGFAAAAGLADPYWDEIDLDQKMPAASGPAGLTEPSRLTPDETEGETAESAATPRERLAGLIGKAPVSIDDLVRASHIPVHLVHALIVELELDGVVQRQGANGVALIANR